MCVPVGDGDGDGDGDGGTGVPVDVVDILFVVDNSGSMGTEQGKLVEAMPEFVQQLDAAGLDYRIAVTTTDNGNVECSGTSPEGGQLRLISCTQRADEFSWPKVNPQVQAYDEACAASCPTSVGDALTVLATSTANDAESRARPWVEVTDGTSNIQGASVSEALACYLPQGVDGCGFESPLESMFKAIQRFAEPGENGYDFHRVGAGLAIAIVTDELDCSANEALQGQVFDRNLPAAQKVFWADPDSNIPTSAICWNAGVACTGSGDPYDLCESFDYAVDGSAAPNPPDDAVMRPVARYRELLQAIEDTDSQNGARDVVFTVIGGVPSDYPTGGDITYALSPDPNTNLSFGVGYGCQTSSGGTLQSGLAPVRMRDLAAAFDLDDGSRNISSVCDASYGPALGRFAAEITSLAQ